METRDSNPDLWVDRSALPAELDPVARNLAAARCLARGRMVSLRRNQHADYAGISRCV